MHGGVKTSALPYITSANYKIGLKLFKFYNNKCTSLVLTMVWPNIQTLRLGNVIFYLKIVGILLEKSRSPILKIVNFFIYFQFIKSNNLNVSFKPIMFNISKLLNDLF
jgi:hypothetical protein